MEPKIYKTDELFKTNYNNLKSLRRAQKLAWFFFIGIGIAYITLTLIGANN